ncbi:hypothetical protein CDAR_383501 [Caerostris darwini]|uniref:Secreted protein n=1 Tax=Caerostris darwini TaxID=1538125 RepID=A0AAV4NY80_9ARAC|nr:hypothetical protein CDAR_383501 [Caerostris darwini]
MLRNKSKRLLGVAKTTCQALSAVANTASTGPVRHMASCEIPATCYPAGIGWQRRPVDSLGLTDRNFSHFSCVPTLPIPPVLQNIPVLFPVLLSPEFLRCR